MGWRRGMLGGLMLLLAGCAGLANGDASPRERALDLMLRYEVVLIAAEGVVASPLLDEAPDTRRFIQGATRTTTDAVLAYDDVTRGCRRVGEEIILMPGDRCEPDEARALLPVAMSAMTTLVDILTTYGAAKEEARR